VNLCGAGANIKEALFITKKYRDITMKKLSIYYSRFAPHQLSDLLKPFGHQFCGL
jgi:hypothetical protein